ncbi:nodal homolog 2-A-like [Tachyglossus aculeatus]|uniref:nodal homolog 2-A-like n=1 Tax=Tachyglossus aculeatus TaxID=9261 RepID=UPI0018F48F62|nr:nodal homolog 2-A-like [Tachyglossus aculeatus]
MAVWGKVCAGCSRVRLWCVFGLWGLLFGLLAVLVSSQPPPRKEERRPLNQLEETFMAHDGLFPGSEGSGGQPVLGPEEPLSPPLPSSMASFLTGSSLGFTITPKSCHLSGHQWILHFEVVSFNNDEVMELKVQAPAGPPTGQPLVLELQAIHEGGGWFLLGSFPVTLPSSHMGSELVLDVTCLLEYWMQLEDVFLGSVVLWREELSSGNRLNNSILLACLEARADRDTVLLVTASPPARPVLIHQADSQSPAKPPSRMAPEVSHGELCQLSDMEVDFRLLPWGSSIVLPKTFNAYRCKGVCPEGFHHLSDFSNYFSMQKQVSCPWKSLSCVPSQLKPLSLMVIEANTQAVVHLLKNMVVAECGCR